MRTILCALLLLSLAPAALARPDLPDLPDPRGDEVRAGPCTLRWSLYWPGETLGARCHDGNGDPLLVASHGTCALGRYTYVWVSGAWAYAPCDATTWTLP